MKIVIFGDTHIQDNNIEELENIFQEIKGYSDEKTILVCLGDYYHSKKITAKELEFGTKWAILFLNYFNKFIMLRGNHPQVTGTEGSVEYFKYLGIEVVDDYVMDNIYFGHKLTEKSEMFFGLNIPVNNKYNINLSDLKHYNYVFLGHQHKPEILDKNIYHLGSVVFTSFNELPEHKKHIAVLENNNLKFIDLKTPTPIKQIKSIKELKNIDKKTKIRIVYNNYEQFIKEIDTINKIKDIYAEFKLKLEFVKNTEHIENKEVKTNVKEIINNWLESIKNEEVKKELKEQFRG